MKIDIGISETERLKVAEGLKKLLSDTFTLYLMTHKYHWNVTGPMFQTLHNMFMTQYTELWNALDEIAERIRALGVMAPGSYSEFQALTTVDQDKDISPKAEQMIANLVDGNESVIRTARSIFSAAEEAGDESTVDLLTQRLQIHEKTAWMLRSLLDK